MKECIGEMACPSDENVCCAIVTDDCNQSVLSVTDKVDWIENYLPNIKESEETKVQVLAQWKI